MGLRPLEIFEFFQCGDRLYSPESDVYRRQIVTYKDGRSAKRVTSCYCVFYYHLLRHHIGLSRTSQHMTQCCFDVGPPSLTAGQHQNNIGSTSRGGMLFTVTAFRGMRVKGSINLGNRLNALSNRRNTRAWHAVRVDNIRVSPPPPPPSFYLLRSKTHIYKVEIVKTL